MAFLKKNLVFCIILGVCVLIFALGAFLSFAESGKVKKAERAFASSEMQLNNLLYADPAPTEENVAAAEENAAQLAAALESIRDELQRGTRLTSSTDSIGVMAAVQQFISDFQMLVDNHRNALGEPAPISVGEDFAFGFERYIDNTEMFEDPEKAAALDKQRQILDYLLTQLIDSDPQAIRTVQREVLEAQTRDGFTIDPAISARVPGAIDTMAFSLTFDGYTDSLRSFLNRLAGFDLPIVVRSISVSRPAGKQTVVAPPARNNNSLDDIFGVFGAPTAPESEPVAAQEPVIEENISTFTVVVEFIEVVLPDAAVDELS